MKKIIFAALFLPTTLIATVEAFDNEVLLVCDAIVSTIIELDADVGIEYEKCVESNEFTTRPFGEGTTIVSGPVMFNYVGRPSQVLQCQLAYINEPNLENVIGGYSCE